jgi:LysM repeat protein
MMQKWMLAGMGLVLFATGALAQGGGYKERATAYVEKHKMFAMAEQQRTGVPAAITLGQGILETEAGNSELATEANNHFGIKCKSTWTGPTFAHTDDAPNECFRKYSSVYESYKDHSDFLKQPRYNPLFKLPVADYDGWAKGLKKYGYATNPRYATQLIKIIEDFNLQDYTFAANTKDIIYPTEGIPTAEAKPAAGIAVKQEVKKEDKKPTVVSKTTKPVTRVIDNTKPPVSKTPTTPVAVAAVEEKKEEQMQTVTEIAKTKEAIAVGAEPGKIVRVNGLRAVYGLKGDVLLTYAIKYNIRYERLLEINEMADAPLKQNMYVFLDKKKTRGGKPTHTVSNETLEQVAQAEGMQIAALRELNRLDEGDEPANGAVLSLQRNATEKPAVIAKAGAAPEMEKKNSKNTKKPTYLEKKELEKAKLEEEQKAIAQKAEDEQKAIAQKAEDEQKAIALKAQQEEEAALKEKEEEEARALALVAQQEEEAKAAALRAQQEEEERKIVMKTKAEKEEADRKAEEERMKKLGNRVVINENEANDEFSRLKSQLDKVVYAGDDRDAEAAKLAEEKKKAEEAKLAEKKKLEVAKAAQDSRFYIVKKGDTAASIAKKNKLTMRQLMEWNNMDWAEVTPGQKLVVKQ